jgi:hypothetical protein
MPSARGSVDVSSSATAQVDADTHRQPLIGRKMAIS